MLSLLPPLRAGKAAPPSLQELRLAANRAMETGVPVRAHILA